MAAAILTEGPTTLRSVPDLADVGTLSAILRELGMRVERTEPHTLALEVVSDTPSQAPYELANKMRASICVLGPLVARRGIATIPLPGGCVIGPRPINLHLKGLRALGASIKIEHGNLVARASRLKGARVFLGGERGSTVLGTANVMMAAALAEGTTVIEHAAREPEIQDLAHYLNACGARISNIGRSPLTIEGVKELTGTDYTIIPDRIEAGTFAAAAAATGGTLTLQGARAEHMQAVLEALRLCGVRTESHTDGLTVQGSGSLTAVNVSTQPYPGFPTDLQPQLTAMLCLARGTSTVTEHVYPQRFTHVEELIRFGAHIQHSGVHTIVKGVERLTGAPVSAPDLRAGAGLLVAALAAEGVSQVHGVHHIDRGYENLEEKLAAAGADIRREALPHEGAA